VQVPKRQALVEPLVGELGRVLAVQRPKTDRQLLRRVPVPVVAAGVVGVAAAGVVVHHKVSSVAGGRHKVSWPAAGVVVQEPWHRLDQGHPMDRHTDQQQVVLHKA